MLGRANSSPDSARSSFLRHLYRQRGVTPNSSASRRTFSQVLMRWTAFHWNFREYRFRFTLLSSPSKV